MHFLSVRNISKYFSFYGSAVIHFLICNLLFFPPKNSQASGKCTLTMYLMLCMPAGSQGEQPGGHSGVALHHWLWTAAPRTSELGV